MNTPTNSETSSDTNSDTNSETSSEASSESNTMITDQQQQPEEPFNPCLNKEYLYRLQSKLLYVEGNEYIYNMDPNAGIYNCMVFNGKMFIKYIEMASTYSEDVSITFNTPNMIIQAQNTEFGFMKAIVPTQNRNWLWNRSTINFNAIKFIKEFT